MRATILRAESQQRRHRGSARVSDLLPAAAVQPTRGEDIPQGRARAASASAAAAAAALGSGAFGPDGETPSVASRRREASRRRVAAARATASCRTEEACVGGRSRASTAWAWASCRHQQRVRWQGLRASARRVAAAVAAAAAAEAGAAAATHLQGQRHQTRRETRERWAAAAEDHAPTIRLHIHSTMARHTTTRINTQRHTK
jgi:hypothetical protein